MTNNYFDLMPKTSLKSFIFMMKIALKTFKHTIFNKGLLLWWYRLWIRKDEFHKSLDIDYEAISVMNDEEKQKYMTSILKRRKLAHDRDINSE